MKIILSRKGFDSGSGGCPSPILPDGRLLPLPIPDNRSPLIYNDINWGDYNAGSVVESVTNGRIKAGDRAHLDPDLNPGSLPRHPDWRPLFGQTGAAQGHLRNQSVGPGDLFLFFGLFQAAAVANGRVQLIRQTPRRHIIWGWLQIEAGLPVDKIDRAAFPWAVYHPHFHRPPDKGNTIYRAKEWLALPDLPNRAVLGAGVFSSFRAALQLTAGDSPLRLWQLPAWMHPHGRVSTLSYHPSPAVWTRRDGYAWLQSAGRGQEFVLDSAHYPEAIGWARDLFTG